MFTIADLAQLVVDAGKALEDEDHYLLECSSIRRWGHGLCGIRENQNERYYQFLIWRKLRRSSPWRVETERQGHDIAFYNDNTGAPLAFVEIKGWWTNSGEAELPGIRRDMEKLGILRVPGVMLIVTWNEKNQAEHNLSWLAERLKISRDALVTYSFNTVAWPKGNDPIEIMTIGFFVPQMATEASA